MDTASPSTTSDVARALREARSRRGESLLQAGANTRISPEYLEALEDDAPMGAFPAPIYARFFLRQYARYLGLDDAALLESFAARHRATRPPTRPIRPLEPDPPRRPSWGAGSLTRAPRAPRRLPRMPFAPAKPDTGRPIFSKRRKPALTAPRRREPALLAALLATLVVGGGLALLLRAGDGPEPAAPRAASVPPPPKELPRGGQTVFPDWRVVAYYGAPHDPDLGILGIGPSKAAARLLEQAEAYAFSPRPVLPAFELIGALATRDPGDDGMFRVRMSDIDIRTYLAEARRVGALFIIDVQPGRSDFMTEVRAFEDLLMEPDVGLALDPEWHVGPGHVPGIHLGSVDGSEINEVVDYLAGIVEEHDLPQKVLIIHQFAAEMIKNKGQVKTVPELAVTFDIDGFGYREAKVGKYQAFSDEHGDKYFHGFKLFYEQDIDLMSPLDVLGLRPTPDFVVYQ